MNLRPLLFAGIIAVVFSCGREESSSPSTSSLLESADKYTAIQDYELAMDYALKALDAAENNFDRTNALCHLAHLDLMTWRDSQAWNHATEAEKLARKIGVDSLLCDALTQMGRVCEYGEITEKDMRVEESMTYFTEALELARATGSVRREIKILHEVAEVCVSMNRFKDPIDFMIYAKAGKTLDRADSLARANGMDDLLANGVLHRMRYYRQGGRIQEGISSCKKGLEMIAEDSYLMQSQIYNQLVMLYSLAGKVEESADAHQKYVYAIEHYMRNKADVLLQEMETRYKASVNEAKAANLKVLAILLSVLAVVMVGATLLLLRYSRHVKKQNRQLSEANDEKERLLSILSKEFSDPRFSKEARDRLSNMTSKNKEEIHKECLSLFPDNPQLAEDVASQVEKYIDQRKKALDTYKFTAREIEIIRLLRDGYKASAIAEKLNISVHTVNNHKQNIYAKLGVKSVSEMLHKAAQDGF